MSFINTAPCADVSGLRHGTVLLLLLSFLLNINLSLLVAPVKMGIIPAGMNFWNPWQMWQKLSFVS